jgi:hypothetical protein
MSLRKNGTLIEGTVVGDDCLFVLSLVRPEINLLPKMSAQVQTSKNPDAGAGLHFSRSPVL